MAVCSSHRHQVCRMTEQKYVLLLKTEYSFSPAQKEGIIRKGRVRVVEGDGGAHNIHLRQQKAKCICCFLEAFC